MGTTYLDKPNLKEINLTDILTQIINEIVNRVLTFVHIDINQLLVCIASNRRNSRGGTFGKLVPLKFEDGLDVLYFKGNYYSMPLVSHNGEQLLYIVYFYLPKFFNLSPREKLRVIFHELYHISPDFNGDIRRLGKVKVSHGHSKERFDSLFEKELQCFYEYIINTPYMDFLRMYAKHLDRNFLRVYGRRMKLPRPVIIQK